MPVEISNKCFKKNHMNNCHIVFSECFLSPFSDSAFLKPTVLYNFALLLQSNQNCKEIISKRI